jgi:selenocysteine-specific elongation factor
MYVIGTAGHVDHGKSTLITALTGIDPDRLAEEKAREMTIDLGFAWLELGDGEEVGVVDVPGHSDFIENMLAGVGGIDLALLVIAADEGVMPQTAEHLAILDLLEISGGVIALTKVDLIDDEDWLELVTLDVSDAVAGTPFEQAPVIPVSATTGVGLEELKAALWDRLSKTEPRQDKGRPRLPVDRVFSLSGFGTVVTGTLVDGRFRVGDQVVVQPAGTKGRIRGLQTHNRSRETAQPGSRVAVNLTGVGRETIKRGDVIAAPDTVTGTVLLDASYRHLMAAKSPLKHNVEVKLFVGAAEVVARTRVLGTKQIEPGQKGWLQLALSASVAVEKGDRFILRRPSPGATLGGGRILDPFPGRRHRRFRRDLVDRLKTLELGSPEELLMQALRRAEPTTVGELVKRSGLGNDAGSELVMQLVKHGEIVRLNQHLVSASGWDQLRDRLIDIVAQHHVEFPLRLGISREELRSRLRLPPPVFAPLLQQASDGGLMVQADALVRMPDHSITFTPHQQKSIDALLQKFSAAGINSPSVKDAREAVGDAVYYALADLGELRPVSPEVVYAKAFYQETVDRIAEYLRANERINAGKTRDLLGTSRKYAIALLEHLDEIKLTRRVGDDRELA